MEVMSNASTLSELGAQIQKTIRSEFSRPCWVVAEIAECRDHSGHCYLELIEKDGTQIKARMRAQVWMHVYRTMKPFFETTTGQRFGAGIEVMLRVTIDYHEVYGLSLNVKDIEPTFTLGASAKRRVEILWQLEKDGSIGMNKELVLSTIPKRIAVISSDSAAGYGDFINQLLNNVHGYKFKLELFSALMQGELAEDSIIAAFESIWERVEDFDVVILIRGGGAVVDLATFDNYNMASHITQFPLPVVVGIGHDRDETVLDLVAHTSVKTPTAAAEFIISKMEVAANYLYDLEYLMLDRVSQLFSDKRSALDMLCNRLPQRVNANIQPQYMELQRFHLSLQSSFEKMMQKKKYELESYLNLTESYNPERIFKLGYSKTYCEGKVLNSVDQVQLGQLITTYLGDGMIISETKKVEE